MSDDIKIEVTSWDGKGEANFEWRRQRMSPLHVWVGQEHLIIEGLQYEGEGSIYLPIDVIKRAIAAADAANKPEET